MTHGLCVGGISRLYQCYRGMKHRCKHDPYYRNVSVCDEWLTDPQSFFDWAMSNGYQDNLTLDRIDNNGNYEPLNCRWVTIAEQQNNKRNNHLVEIDGVTKTVSEWSRFSGIPYSTLSKRIKRGWKTERLLTPVKR